MTVIDSENLALIDRVIAREGGDRSTDDRADRGGVTKFGITQPALAEFLGHPITRDDVRALTLDCARPFYAWLLVDSRVAEIPNLVVREVVFDAVVNHGRRPGIRLLQRALGLRDDGVIGPLTLAAVPHLDARRLAVRALTVVGNPRATKIDVAEALVAGDFKQLADPVPKRPARAALGLRPRDKYWLHMFDALGLAVAAGRASTS